MIKYIKGWELSNESEKFAVKLVGGAATKDMVSYVEKTIERTLSNVTLTCGINDLKTSTNLRKMQKISSALQNGRKLIKIM